MGALTRGYLVSLSCEIIDYRGQSENQRPSNVGMDLEFLNYTIFPYPASMHFFFFTPGCIMQYARHTFGKKYLLYHVLKIYKKLYTLWITNNNLVG